MTRKHYRQFASMINEQREQIVYDNVHNAGSDSGLKILQSLSKDMAGIFKRDNSAFSYTRFYVACGFPELEDGKR